MLNASRNNGSEEQKKEHQFSDKKTINEHAWIL